VAARPHRFDGRLDLLGGRLDRLDRRLDRLGGRLDRLDRQLYWRGRPDTLGELDLVVTPVSVTPPRTWRRAAWFAVAASCAVLTVLVFAAVRLAGGSFDRVEAFPGLPTGGLLTAQPLGPPVRPPLPLTTAGDDRAAPHGGPSTAAAGNPGGAGGPHGDGRGGVLGDSTGTWTATPTADPPGESVPPPQVSVLPTVGHPAATPDDLVDGTRTFYDQLPANIDAAWAMVGPRVKVQGYDAFRQQWAGATEVHLQQLVVDADKSTVLATVGLVMGDGVERVQRYRLVFRRGNPMIIDEITPIAERGPKPPK